MTLTLIVEAPATARPAPLRLDARDAVIGRGPEVDWVLADPLVSARHCEIGYRNGLYLIRDTSTNGTTVNGQPLAGIHRLAEGDRLGIGGYVIRVREGAAAEGPRDTSVQDALATGLATLLATRARQLTELGVTRPDALARNPLAVEPDLAAERLRTLDEATASAAVAQAVDAIERHHAACLDAMAATLRATVADLSPDAIAAAVPGLPAGGDARDAALWRAFRARVDGGDDGRESFVSRFARAFRTGYERLAVGELL